MGRVGDAEAAGAAARRDPNAHSRMAGRQVGAEAVDVEEALQAFEAEAQAAGMAEAGTVQQEEGAVEEEGVCVRLLSSAAPLLSVSRPGASFKCIRAYIRVGC
jgi:hypothetical protein